MSLIQLLYVNTVLWSILVLTPGTCKFQKIRNLGKVEANPLSQSEEDINMLDELFKRFDGAYAENTLRAYRSDMMDFMEWCDHNNLQFDNPPGEDLASYVEDMSRLDQLLPFADA